MWKSYCNKYFPLHYLAGLREKKKTSLVQLSTYQDVFPDEKRWLTDQIGRSSKSVCASLAEAYATRRYPGVVYR
nr:four helix bundle protein [Neolewinella xylanilytica]